MSNVRMSKAGGGPMIATDMISNIHYPRHKVGFGAAGSYTDVSSDNPLPVSLLGFSALNPLPVSLGSAAIKVYWDGVAPVGWSSPMPVYLPVSPLPVSLPTGPLSVQEANPASASPMASQLAKAKAGTAFTWSSGIISLTSIATGLRVLLKNPTANKTIYITSITASSAAAQVVLGKLIDNPASGAGLPTNPGIETNNSIGGGFAGSGMNIFADASLVAMTGGTARGSILFNQSRNKSDDGVIILKPGQSIGVYAVFVLAISVTALAEVSFSGWVE